LWRGGFSFFGYLIPLDRESAWQLVVGINQLDGIDHDQMDRMTFSPRGETRLSLRLVSVVLQCLRARSIWVFFFHIPCFFSSGGGDLLMPRFPLSATQGLGWVEHRICSTRSRPRNSFTYTICTTPPALDHPRSCCSVRILDCHRTLVGTSSTPGVEIRPTVPVSLAGTCFDEFADA
jgi:hypothetical protein